MDTEKQDKNCERETPYENPLLNCFPPSLAGGIIGSVVVMVTRKWEEFDLMFTHDICSVDLVIVDVQVSEMHAVIPQHLIGQFADEISEGHIYSIDNLHLISAKTKFRPSYNQNRVLFVSETSITALEHCLHFNGSNKSRFTEFAMLGPEFDNLYLTAVVGLLKTITDYYTVRQAGGQCNKMLKITIQNHRGETVEISLSGTSAEQAAGIIIDIDSLDSPVMVAVSSTYVKCFRGKFALMSTNTTRVSTSKGYSAIVEMCNRIHHPCAWLPHQLTYPPRLSLL